MSDIGIIIPAGPFLVAGGLAAIIGGTLLWAAWRTSGWRRWLACGLGLASALVALASGALGLLLAGGY